MMPADIDDINLENYTSSKGFLGFFEREKIIPRRKAALAAIADVLPFFADCCVATSCYLYGSVQQAAKTYDIPEQDVSRLLDPLVAGGLLNCLTRREREPSLRVLSPIDNVQLTNMCLAVMEVDGVHGHLFLHKDRLVAYPHEDVGFGFFATEQDSAERGRQIVQKMRRGPWC